MGFLLFFLFAWYTATTGGALADNQKASQDLVSTGTAVQITGVSFPVQVTAVFDSESPMGLMTWNTDHFEEKYYLNGDNTSVAPTRTKVYAANGSDIPAQNYRLLTVTVTIVNQPDIGGVAYAKEAILDALIANGDGFSVNVTAKDSSGNDTKAMFYSAGSKAAPTAEGANSLELEDNQAWTASQYTYTFTCGVYVDGDGSSYNQEVKGDVTATIAAVSNG